jgi:hypothetical protein
VRASAGKNQAGQDDNQRKQAAKQPVKPAQACRVEGAPEGIQAAHAVVHRCHQAGGQIHQLVQELSATHHQNAQQCRDHRAASGVMQPAAGSQCGINDAAESAHQGQQQAGPGHQAGECQQAVPAIMVADFGLDLRPGLRKIAQ